jgi:1-acyl-sn-glycerol-3-phosphate acyltransferase
MQKEQIETKNNKMSGKSIKFLGGAVIWLVQVLIRLFAKLCMWPFFRLSGEGGQHALKVDGPVLVISNHKSYFDPLVIAAALPVNSSVYPLRFIAQDLFFGNFLSAAIFYSMGSFPTYYGQGIDKSLEKPTEILKEGGSVVFFPEGRCIRNDKIGEGKIGAATLAMRVPDVTILPIAIHGSHMIGRIFRPVQVRVCVGAPFKLKSVLAKQATAEELTGIFMGKIEAVYSKANERRRSAKSYAVPRYSDQIAE